MNSFTDYYTLLGVSADASSDTIKAAFKRLALQYHPDVYKGEDAQERMRVLLLAYKTLNDPIERQLYDARHSEHFLDGHTPRGSYARGGSARQSPPMSGPMKRRASDVSPAARRDRQRHYDFPDLRDGSPVHVDLIDMAYTLSPGEARTLRQQGMLRGSAPETEDHSYYCHRCHHRWTESSTRADTNHTPRNCPKCQASDWTEYLLLRCIHCCAIFESEQIRYEIGAYSYGKGTLADLCPPYELFPLCPYCGTARWCPAEDARVEELGLRAARRAATRRLMWMWISVAIIAVVILGSVMFGVLH